MIHKVNNIYYLAPYRKHSPTPGLEHNPNNTVKANACGLPYIFICWQSLDNGWSLNLNNLVIFVFLNIRSFLNFLAFLNIGYLLEAYLILCYILFLKKFLKITILVIILLQKSLSMFPTIDKMTNRHLKENFDGKCIIVVVGVRETKG